MVADSGAPGGSRGSSASATRASRGCPRTSSTTPATSVPLRRLVSTFLSPLASSYLLVVALLLAAAWLAPAAGAALVLWLGTVALLFSALLWTHSRSSVPRPRARPARLRPGATAVAALARRLGGAVVGVGLVFVKVYPHVAPQTTYTPHELECQRRNAHPEQRPAELRLPARAVGAARRLEAGPAAGRPAVSGSRTRAPRATGGASGPGSRRCSGTPRASASGTPARPRRDRRRDQGRRVDLYRARRRNRARRRPALHRVVARSCSGGCCPATPGSAPRSQRCSRSGCRRTCIGVPWLVYVLWPLLGVYVSRPDL